MNAKRILVVDDSPIELRLTTRLLSQAGYETVTALTGEQALRFALEVRVDAMVLDIHMPGMDGFEVCRLLKENLATARLPVILYSVRDEVTDVLRGEEVGADDFLAKSAGKERLLRSLENLLGGQGQRERATPTFDFSVLEQVADRLSAEEFAQTIAQGFAVSIRPVLEGAVGASSAQVLMAIALRKLSDQFPFLGESASPSLYPFIEDRVREAPPAEILRGFHRLADTIDALMTKIAQAGVYTAGHLKAITPEDASDVRSSLAALAQRLTEVAVGAPSREAAAGPRSAPGPASAMDGVPAESTAVLLFHLDGSGSIINCDATALETFGYDRMALLGASFVTVVDESSHHDFASLLELVKTTGQGDGRLLLKKREGERVVGRISLTALYDPLGQFVMAKGQVQLEGSRSGDVERQ